MLRRAIGFFSFTVHVTGPFLAANDLEELSNSVLWQKERPKKPSGSLDHGSRWNDAQERLQEALFTIGYRWQSLVPLDGNHPIILKLDFTLSLGSEILPLSVSAFLFDAVRFSHNLKRLLRAHTYLDLGDVFGSE